MRDDERRGMWFAIACYAIWGIFPLYFRLLAPVPAIDILAHRVIWSLGFLLILLTARQEWSWLGPALRSRRTLGLYALAGVILAANWYTYIWAVNAGFVIESSLGYFINPLVSVLLGVAFMRERLRVGQWAAIATATAGVLFLTVSYGQLPWIALILAFTFGFYGLLKKHGTLRSIQGLTIEAGTLLLPALALLLFRRSLWLRQPGELWLGQDVAAALHRRRHSYAARLVCFGRAADPAVAARHPPIRRTNAAIPGWPADLPGALQHDPTDRLRDHLAGIDHLFGGRLSSSARGATR
jgi:RarD protein